MRIGPVKVPQLPQIPPRSEWPIPGIRPGWGELSRVGKVRRVVYWVAMLGNVGLIVSAETSGSDLNLQADGTKRPKGERAPDVQGAPPARDQADEEPATEKRDQPEAQEGTAANTTA